jgi:hypothetical protein
LDSTPDRCCSGQLGFEVYLQGQDMRGAIYCPPNPLLVSVDPSVSRINARSLAACAQGTNTTFTFAESEPGFSPARSPSVLYFSSLVFYLVCFAAHYKSFSCAP